jgi:hypothetical protein
MTALANSLRRISAANNRVPRLTGWGFSGPVVLSETVLVVWARETLRDVVALAHQTAPTLIVVLLNIFR